MSAVQMVQYQSPHYNDRPQGTVVSLLVIHCISLPAGEFATPYIHDLFMGQLDCDADPSFRSLQGVRVSAHLVIFRDGSVHQYVPFNKRAWHAGQSEFQGHENCNDYSIGIELEGTEQEPYTEAQYQSLIQVTALLCRFYPAITAERIVGHQQIAPGRKTDPGPSFDWERYLHAVKENNV
ncbi:MULTISPECIES: 1,6-anhydro-N-acetylmuramyl-L-alanine amidase AmpD [Rheinheimera]|uniref:1,6-anhydro-N-acetylmuramyl-L-alanine amidase AmpD n=1 Tax=Rheinheimera marina TaxID=1774958 RepID=A0ABV9JP94_9GAMM